MTRQNAYSFKARKLNTIYFWASLWIIVIFLFPQLPTGLPQAPSNRTRGIHPFFNWHLFSSVSGNTLEYGVEPRNCEKLPAAAPADVLSFTGDRASHTYFEQVRRYMFYRRLEYIAVLYRTGQAHQAEGGLSYLLHDLRHLMGRCEYRLYYKTLRNPEIPNTNNVLSKTYLEGPKLEF